MIKCIATHMDGLFSSDSHDDYATYFENIYTRMKLANIQFVVISEYQFYQISSFFDDPDILYVAENGAWIRTLDEEFYHAHMDEQTMIAICEIVQRYPCVHLCVSARRFAYVTREEDRELMKSYFPKIKWVHDFHEIKDTIFKITMLCDDENRTNLLQELHAFSNEKLEITLCKNWLHITIKGCNRGFALKLICEQLDISPQECMYLANDDDRMDGGNRVQPSKDVLKTIDAYLMSIDM